MASRLNWSPTNGPAALACTAAHADKILEYLALAQSSPTVERPWVDPGQGAMMLSLRKVRARQKPMQRYLQISVHALIITAFLALALTGRLDAPSVALFSIGVGWSVLRTVRKLAAGADAARRFRALLHLHRFLSRRRRSCRAREFPQRSTWCCFWSW